MSKSKCKIYMAADLASRYPEIYWNIYSNLTVEGIEVKTVYRTCNIWLRDYFPVDINGKLFKFAYKASKFPQLDISNEPWTGCFDRPVFEHPLITLDGGNIVKGHNKIVLTEKVIKDNGASIVGILEKLFDSEIIIIPIEPGDTLGHSDGICKFVNERNILVNDYSGVAKRDKRFYAYQEELETIFHKHDLNVWKFPNAYDEWNWNLSEKEFRKFFPQADEYNPAFGYYINFIQVGNTILLPAMKIKKDKDAYECLKKHFPACRIVMIDCSKLSMEGGLLHCISWYA